MRMKSNVFENSKNGKNSEKQPDQIKLFYPIFNFRCQTFSHFCFCLAAKSGKVILIVEVIS